MTLSQLSPIQQCSWLRYHLIILAVALSETTARPALFENVPGLSAAARESLVAYYDGSTGVVSDKSGVVISWTPVDGTGAPLASMVVTQSGAGLDLITYDLKGKLSFFSTDGSASRHLRGHLVAPAGIAYTVVWRGRHSIPAPFASDGNYVYNIGNEINHQRQVNSGVPAVELYDGNTTFRGKVNISVIDNAPTVYSTIYNGKSSHRAYADGIDLGIPGAPNYSVKADPEILIGSYSSGGFDFNGELTDLLVFNTVLSDADRLLLEEHLIEPELAITQLGATLRLVWPSSATDFILESASSIPVLNWEPVTNSPVMTTGKLVVTNAVSEVSRFYRLRK